MGEFGVPFQPPRQELSNSATLLVTALGTDWTGLHPVLGTRARHVLGHLGTPLGTPGTQVQTSGGEPWQGARRHRYRQGVRRRVLSRLMLQPF
jgi:hypothetical protein